LPTRIAWRPLPAQIGVVLAFALLPLWLRVPQIPLFAPLYVTRFALFLPMLLAIGGWLIAGMPGLGALRRADGGGGHWRRGSALCLLVLAAWAALSTQWAFIRFREPDVAGTAALGFCVVALFAVVVACVASPRAIVAALAFGVVWSAPIVIVQALQQSWIALRALGEFPITADMLGVSLLRAGDLTYVRPYGLMPHPNTAAGVLLVGTLAAAAMLFARGHTWRGRLIRLGGAAVVTLGVSALLLTFSRAAWLGLAAGGVTGAILLLRHLRRREIWLPLALTIGSVMVVGVVWFAAYRPFVSARTLGDSAADGGQESIELRSVSDRLVFIDFALRSIRERPLIGVGMGNFPWRTSYYLAETFYDLRGDNVHHIYLSVWAELGTIGLILFGSALVCGSIAVLQARPMTPARAGLFAVVVALAVVGWFDHYPWTLLHFQVALWGCLAAAGKDRTEGKGLRTEQKQDAKQNHLDMV